MQRRFAAGVDVNESAPLPGHSLALAGKPIYHTNVLMCVATEFAMVGFDMIPDARRAAEVRARLQESGRKVIPLSARQIAEFAGNAIELSQRAYASFSEAQKGIIERSARLVPLAVPTIEMAGGSVRCMIAGIHLSPRH